MQVARRHGDGAILEVSAPNGALAPRDGADIVTLTAFQQAHMQALSIPPGEVMALGDDGTIYVLEYAPPDPAVEVLRAFATEHPDPAVRVAAARLGLV